MRLMNFPEDRVSCRLISSPVTMLKYFKRSISFSINHLELAISLKFYMIANNDYLYHEGESQ